MQSIHIRTWLFYLICVSSFFQYNVVISYCMDSWIFRSIKNVWNGKKDVILSIYSSLFNLYNVPIHLTWLPQKQLCIASVTYLLWSVCPQYWYTLFSLINIFYLTMLWVETLSGIICFYAYIVYSFR